MMSASFGREIAESHFRRLFEEAEHDRLVDCLKRQRRHRHKQGDAASARARAPRPCPQDLG